MAVILAEACVLGLTSFGAISCGSGSGAGTEVRPISNRILYPSEALRLLWNSVAGRPEPAPPECGDFIRHHPPAFSRPIRHVAIPKHPFMAARGGNNMHCNAYMSDSYEAAGPLGVNPRVSSRTQGFGGYGTIAFDKAGRLVAVYSNGRGFQIELMDPYTLQELAAYDLPSRPWYFLLQGVWPWQYIGAGMYFYLDNEDRAVVPTTRNSIEVVQVPDPAGHEGFKRVRKYDLAAHVVPTAWPREDSVAWVLPDWQGDYYWYATTAGIVGTVGVDSGAVRTMRLKGEVIENSFAVGEDGVYIVSDQALYRFSRGRAGEIDVDWRTAYDRGPHQKPGHISRGSGTSVTLLGDPQGLVAIADNAEPRIKLLFIKRADGAIACSVPVFKAGKSGTDVSVVGFEHADRRGRGTGTYSVLIENNWGNHSFPRSYPERGLTRVDAVRHADGRYTCEEVWASKERSIGVFKLSLGNGLAYMYWRSPSCPVTQWYFTAVDFRSGETVYKALAGKGEGYNNWAGALFLHPDGGTAYSTTIFGLVMLRDGAA